MNPREYVARLEEFVRDGHDAEALDLAERFGSEVAPQLDAETFFRISALLEGAELAMSTALSQPATPRPSRRRVRPA